MKIVKINGKLENLYCISEVLKNEENLNISDVQYFVSLESNKMFAGLIKDTDSTFEMPLYNPVYRSDIQYYYIPDGLSLVSFGALFGFVFLIALLIALDVI